MKKLNLYSDFYGAIYRATYIMLIVMSSSAIVTTTSHAQDTLDISYESFSKSLPCSPRIGRCFDTTIAGIKVTPIKDKTRQAKLYQDARAKNSKIKPFYWELAQEVEGDKAIDIETMSNALGLPHVGEEDKEADIMITPLQAQNIASKESLSSSNNVNIGGKPAVTVQNTLEQDYLPPGEYVLSIRYNGDKNWDRKEVLIKVKASEQKPVVVATTAANTTAPATASSPATSVTAATNSLEATTAKPVVLTTIQAGGWEIRSTITATDVETAETKTMVDGMLTKFCYTQAFVDKHPFLTPGIEKDKMVKKNAQCKISNEVQTANTASWHMGCNMQDKSYVFSKISNAVTATSFQSNMIIAVSSNAKAPVINMKIMGTHLGACTPEMMVQ
jgi:Protein of unknown function (DUF3617)